MGEQKTTDHIQIKIKMPNQSKDPSASLKALNQYLNDKDVLYTFKIKILSQNSIYGCVKYHWLYSN